MLKEDDVYTIWKGTVCFGLGELLAARTAFLSRRWASFGQALKLPRQEGREADEWPHMSSLE